VPFIRDYIAPTGVGYGILSASIVLGIMILPTIVSVSLDALNSVPESYYEGALALGATKEQTTFKVMLPAAKSGVFAGVVLAIGRAIGETMAVIMVIGGSPELPESLFQSVRTLTANIAMGAMELTTDARSALIACGVVLFVFTLLLNVSFSFLKRDKKEKNGKKEKRNAAAKKQAELSPENPVRKASFKKEQTYRTKKEGERQ
ncbi:MAG: PstC family ABC transporter permease, partial [Candidatus Scatosoma sp.]